MQKGEGERVSVLFCGHFTCDECVEGLLKTKPAHCPMCRERIDLTPDQVMTVTIRKPLTAQKKEPASARPVNAELENNDVVERFGSKVYEFVKFAQRTMRINPESKIILFIQFDRCDRLLH